MTRCGFGVAEEILVAHCNVDPTGLLYAGESGGNFNSARSGSVFGRKDMNRACWLVPKYSGQGRHGLLADRLNEREWCHGGQGICWRHSALMSAMRVRMDAARAAQVLAS